MATAKAKKRTCKEEQRDERKAVHTHPHSVVDGKDFNAQLFTKSKGKTGTGFWLADRMEYEYDLQGWSSVVPL